MTSWAILNSELRQAIESMKNRKPIGIGELQNKCLHEKL